MLMILELFNLVIDLLEKFEFEKKWGLIFFMNLIEIRIEKKF